MDQSKKLRTSFDDISNNISPDFSGGKTSSKIYEICKLPVNFVLEILSFPEILKRISLLTIFCVIMNNDQQHQEKNHRTERENQGISRGMSISLKLFLA